MTDPLSPWRLIQLSDCHLFADPSGCLLGMNTQDSLNHVLALISDEQPAIAAILASGDLAQDASMDAYQRLYQCLSPFQRPIFWLEGNHDKPAPMIDGLGGDATQISPAVVQLGNWTLVLMDSTTPGAVGGNLYPDDLAFLDNAITHADGEHIMVCMHHQPVAMGSAWLDRHLVGGADAFFEILARSDKVRSVVWGHVHQVFDQVQQGVRLMSAPSTCVQFKPHSDQFAVDTLNPGYRWMDLYPDGRIVSDVSRVQGVQFQVDTSGAGY